MFSAVATLSEQQTVTATRLLAGAYSQQQQAVQASVGKHSYRSPEQKQGPSQQQQQLPPVTVMMTCYTQHMLSSLSFSQASSLVKSVLQLVSKPPAEMQFLPQRTQDKVLLEEAFLVPLKGQPAGTAPRVARHCLRVLSLRPVCSGPWLQPAAVWLPGRSLQPKTKP